MSHHIDIALLPAEAMHSHADCYVVVDLLRATTTIATLFGSGLQSLVASNDIDIARERAKTERRLLFGEVRGLPPAGFDYGNSPVEAGAADVAGAGAVLFTTNGTAALCSLANRGVVVTGALANATSVATFAAQFGHVCIVCAGDLGGTTFSLEDFAAAGVIAAHIAEKSVDPALGDAVRLALELVPPSVLDQATRGSQHAKRLVALGLEADVGYASRTDTSSAVPIVTACGPGWALLENHAR